MDDMKLVYFFICQFFVLIGFFGCGVGVYMFFILSMFFIFGGLMICISIFVGVIFYFDNFFVYWQLMLLMGIVVEM